MAITAATTAEWGKFTLPTGSELALFERLIAAVEDVIARDYVLSDPLTSAQEQAILIKANKVWRRRDSVDGVASFSDFGPIRVSQFEDPDVTMLLERRWSFA